MRRTLSVPGWALMILAVGVSPLLAADAAPTDGQPPAKAPAVSAKPVSRPVQTAPQAGKHLLRYQFHEGQTLRWEVIHRARITTTVSGTTQIAETVSQSIKAWRVKEVRPDGTAVFEHRVESVDMSQKLSGSQEVRYNSKTDAKPPHGFENVAESLGVPLSVVTINSRGEILSRQRHQVRAAAAETDSLMTVPFPEKPVAAGEIWALPFEVNVPMPGGSVKKVKTTQKFTLKEVKNGVALIEVATVILTPVHDPAVEAQLIQRESSGIVRFDLDAGRVVGQQMDVDKRVIGFRGDASSLHYLSRFTEEVFAEPAQTAAAPESVDKK